MTGASWVGSIRLMEKWDQMEPSSEQKERR